MKKKEQRFQSIISIDEYNERYYRYENGELKRENKLQFKKRNYYTTFIANKDLIIAPVTISRNIEEEDIAGALEDKAYDELGLDPAVDYIIHYQEMVGEGEGRNFQLFVIEKQRYGELFSSLRQSLRYLDLILPAPLLYRALYDYEIVESRKVHCFLYFTNYDATVTFYRNGTYLYSKSINYSLRQLYDRYCEIAGKTVDEKQFFRIFQKEGVKTTHLEFQQNLIKLFNEIFITINDVVIYTKRAYKVDVIDQMYIGSELGPISGADEYAQNYLGLYSSSMFFDFGIKSEEWYVDQLHYMMILNTQKYWDEPETFINFTRYPRPPAFPKRASGQFILALVAAIVLASSYPLYFLVSSYLLDFNNLRLKKQERSLSAEVRKYKSILGKKRAEIKKLKAEIDKLKNVYTSKEKTLQSVYEKKVNYRLKSNQFALFSKDLAHFSVNSDRFRNLDNLYIISLISPNDRNITSLVKYITRNYKNEISTIDIEHIAKDKNTSMYRGTLKVNIK
ncbi:hypothetical protein [Nitratifractor sp.]